MLQPIKPVGRIGNRRVNELAVRDRTAGGHALGPRRRPKSDRAFFDVLAIKRDITEQPIFYLALVAVVIGVQLFVTGFLAEMFAMQSLSRRDYLIVDKVGLEERLTGETVGVSYYAHPETRSK